MPYPALEYTLQYRGFFNEQIPFSTPITELFGTRLPIVAGGLMWLGESNYVAATSLACIIDFITAASVPESDALRSEIWRCQDLFDAGSVRTHR